MGDEITAKSSILYLLAIVFLSASGFVEFYTNQTSKLNFVTHAVLLSQ